MPSSTRSLSEPGEFVASLQRAIAAVPPPLTNNTDFTRWFEARMQALARERQLRCYNKSADNPCELLNIDHVFTKSDEYDAFPIIAVEHENGPLGSRDGELPLPNTGEYIEWATWKTLAMRVELSVVVAYPYDEQENAFRAVLTKMAKGWMRQHGQCPPLLVLAGWWSKNKADFARPHMYEALVPDAVGTLQTLGRISYPR
ncbi:MAG TPA: hypothetical protein VLQ93_11205 [Myxococcaceae bacterium]|nr:hypothetical protein [Myxococcaceae bacterium]